MWAVISARQCLMRPLISGLIKHCLAEMTAHIMPAPYLHTAAGQSFFRIGLYLALYGPIYPCLPQNR